MALSLEGPAANDLGGSRRNRKRQSLCQERKRKFGLEGFRSRIPGRNCPRLSPPRALLHFSALISLPFVPLIYLLVKLNTPGPFIFKQIRVGKNSKNFLAMKIRTMHKNAEINGPQWATKNDLRVTRSGKILRKTRIDEIPQLFNILRGEMSFIGPRPERPEFVKNLNAKIPFYNERHLVKPGLTGWAQINFPYGASEADALEKLQYDLYYIKNRSIMLDIAILLKTIKTVLTGAGQ